MSATNNRSTPSGVARPPPPALDPERPALVQPWRDFQGRGFVEIHYLGGALSVVCKVKLLAPVLTSEEKASGADVYVGPQEAKQRIIDLKLWTPREKGTKGKKGEVLVELPKRSICKKDFEGNDNSLLSRARSVAKTLGEQTVSGRIGSIGLTIEDVETFGDWWEVSGPDRKARILTDKKHFESLSAENKTRLDSVLSECPFRSDGAIPTKSSEEPPAEKEKGKAPQKAAATPPRQGTTPPNAGKGTPKAAAKQPEKGSPSRKN